MVNPSQTPPSSNSSSKKKIQLAGIIGAVALLAIVMYPGTFGQPGSQQISSQAQKPTPLTVQQQSMCNSILDELNATIPNDDNHTAAVDLLNGEYCSRGDLVNQLGNRSNPGIGLAAYACEATRGTIKDPEAADTLQMFSDLYCTGAKQGLASQTTDLIAATNALENSTQYAQQATQISATLVSAQAMTNSTPYSAYLKASDASKAFEQMVASSIPPSSPTPAAS